MVPTKGGVMTDVHPDLDEWIGSGVTTGTEQAQFVAQHLRVCTLCAAEATRLQAAAPLLGGGGPPPEPALAGPPGNAPPSRLSDRSMRWSNWCPDWTRGSSICRCRVTAACA